MVGLLQKKVIQDKELYLKVLGLLIENGVNVNQYFSLEKFTPLYGYVRLLCVQAEWRGNRTVDVKYASRDEFVHLSTKKVFSTDSLKNSPL